MTHPCIRPLAYAALFGIGFAGAACTAILAPNDDVQRCSSADDCDPTGDDRYVTECRYDEDNLDLDATEVDKICVAAFATVSCDPDDYAPMGGDHPFRVAYDSLSTQGRYSCTGFEGQAGCPPAPGEACVTGSVNDNGVCDPGGEYPIYVPNNQNGLYGQDVLDAFCQSFFCEGRWTCDADRQCVRCDPDKAIGDGGCGTVYVGGAPSCVYPGEQLACGEGNTDLDAPRFGCTEYVPPV